MKFKFYTLLLAVSFFYACKKSPAVLSTFRLLDPGKSNVKFINQITESDSLNILDYLYFYNGAGLASADFNNDGFEDLYFVSNQGSNKLYLNNKDFTFDDITDKAGVRGQGDWKTGVTIVDINGDGFKDIYLSVVSGYRSFKGKNQLYINNGNLTFTESAADYGIDFAGLSTQASFFDYDKDDDLDLFILTHSVHSTDTYGDSTQRFKYSHDAGDHLFRNDNNQFTDVTKSSGIYSAPIGYGLGISIADLNNDGWDDIYISNDFFEQDYYYINQQNGTFKEKLKEAFGHTSLFSMGNTVSDINKDGHLDLISTDMLPEDIKVLKSTINDEALDVYNLEVKSGFYYQYSRNSLQLNVGAGEKFIDIGLYSGIAATDWTWSPLVHDFDMDGKKDIFFSNGIKKRLNDLDYLKYLGNPNVVKEFKTNRIFDRKNIERMPDGKVHNFLYKGDGLLKFNDVSFSNDMSEPSSSSGAIMVDLDNDGDLEIVTSNIDEPAFIYQNLTIGEEKENKPGYLKLKVKYSQNNRDGIGAKLYLKTTTGVDHQEVQTSNAFQSSQDLNMLFTFSHGEKPIRLLIIWPDNSWQVIESFQLNRHENIIYDSLKVSGSNNVADLIKAFVSDSKQFNNKKVEAKLLTTVSSNETPDFNYYSLLPHAYLPKNPPLALTDLNGDSQDDLYVGGIAGQEKYLLISSSNGSFKKVKVEGFNKFLDYSDSEALWADLDNDGDMDLVVQSANHPFSDPDKIKPARVYINKGNFQFDHKVLPALKFQTSKIGLLDFNGDGLTDVYLSAAISYRNYTSGQTAALFLNKGNGVFNQTSEKKYSDLLSISHVRNIVIADVDRNGKEDLVMAAEWKPIQIFLNKGRGDFVKWSSPLLDNMKGWWQNVLVADVNADGKSDLLAGNWGLNNKYHVSEANPLLAYNSDVDRDGRNDLILSYHHKGKYYPFRPKSDLEQELPYLKKEWLSYQEMADKTTMEIFKDKLDEKGKLSVSKLSSIFVSDIVNAKKATDLPFLYQQAPIRHIFSGIDKKANQLVISGNFSGVIPYEGKYDALGIVSMEYDKTRKQFMNPQYWINPSINFEEIEFMQPLKSKSHFNWLVMTYEGQVFMLSDKQEDTGSSIVRRQGNRSE